MYLRPTRQSTTNRYIKKTTKSQGHCAGGTLLPVLIYVFVVSHMHMIRVSTEIEGEAFEEEKQNETNPSRINSNGEKGGKRKTNVVRTYKQPSDRPRMYEIFDVCVTGTYYQNRYKE